MIILYADSSAIVRAYLDDEPDHLALRALLLDGIHPVVTSDISRVEVASALSQAHRGGRLPRPFVTLRRFDHDCRPGGRFATLTLRPDVILPRARAIVLQQSIGTLDAIHLAVALEEAPIVAGDEPVVFVTRDARQAAAAAALGLEVA